MQATEVLLHPSACFSGWLSLYQPWKLSSVFHNDCQLKLAEGELVSHKDSYEKAAHKNRKIC